MFNIRSIVLAITLALTTLTVTGCKSCTSETEAGADATVAVDATVDAAVQPVQDAAVEQ